MSSMLNRGWGLPDSSLRSNLSLICFYLSPSACMALLLLSFSVNVLAVSVELTFEDPPNYHYSVTIIDPGYYNMFKERVNGGSWVAAQASETSGNTFTFHYKPDGKYEYRVQYCRDYSDFRLGCPNYSDNIVTVLVGFPPDAPTGLSVENSIILNSGSLEDYEVSWNPVSGVSYYELLIKGETGGWQLHTTSATSLSLPSEEGFWLFKVRACTEYSRCSEDSFEARRLVVKNEPSSDARAPKISLGAVQGNFTEFEINVVSNVYAKVFQMRPAGGEWQAISPMPATITHYSDVVVNKFVYFPHGNYEFRVGGCWLHPLAADACGFSQTLVLGIGSELTITPSPRAILSGYTYGYDKAGRLTNVFESSPSYSSTQNGSTTTIHVNETEKETHYTYDDADNRLTKTYGNK